MDAPTTNPLAIASIVFAVLGVIVYCCGSFLCLGWIAPLIWVVGLILGGVAIAQGGESKTLGIVGAALNGLLGLAFLALLALGISAGVLSALLQGSGY